LGDGLLWPVLGRLRVERVRRRRLEPVVLRQLPHDAVEPPPVVRGLPGLAGVGRVDFRCKRNALSKRRRTLSKRLPPGSHTGDSDEQTVALGEWAMKQHSTSRKLQHRGLKPQGIIQFGSNLTQISFEKFDFDEVIALLGGEPDDVSIAAEALADAFSVQLEHLARVSASAQKLLHGAGLPATNDLVKIRADGSWESLGHHLTTSDGLRTIDTASMSTEHLMRGLAYSAQKGGSESNIWFAATLLDVVAEMVAKIKANDATRAASLAMLAGRLIERYWWKLNHEKPATRGRASDKGRQKAQPRGTMVQKERGSRRYRAIVRAANKLWADKPSMVGKASETARDIEMQQLTALRLKGSNFLGFDSIRMNIGGCR
jgi:hypothetical protein